MVIWVKEEEMELFMPLIPAKMQEAVISGDWFCLGALAEPSGEEEEREAAGVMLFSPEEGVSIGNEQSTMIILHWLYVAEEYRNQGLANEMMDGLADALDDSPAEGVVCDVPFGSEYDLAEAFFVSWGFQFDVVDSHEMTITKEDCRKQVSDQNKMESLSLATAGDMPSGMASILELSQEAFRDAVRTAKKLEKSGYYDLISEFREDYTGDMSYVIQHDGQVSSIVLFEGDAESDLHMVMLATLNPKGEKELLKLLHYVAGYYYLNYPEGTNVRLTLGTERSRKLAGHIFPGKEPVMVRRGVFY